MFLYEKIRILFLVLFISVYGGKFTPSFQWERRLQILFRLGLRFLSSSPYNPIQAHSAIPQIGLHFNTPQTTKGSWMLSNQELSWEREDSSYASDEEERIKFGLCSDVGLLCASLYRPRGVDVPLEDIDCLDVYGPRTRESKVIPKRNTRKYALLPDELWSIESGIRRCILLLAFVLSGT